jgi:hypothetical protein
MMNMNGFPLPMQITVAAGRSAHTSGSTINPLVMMDDMLQ